MSEQAKRTVFYDQHVDLGARIVDFSGWQMPIQYSQGIVAEHLATRKHAGLFDVSHMGRFRVTGSGAEAFLRKVLTNDCEKLAPGVAHYTILANEAGGAIDDAFLYRPTEDKFLLVFNASNKDKDWAHLQSLLGDFSDVVLEDVSDEVAMVALQGPASESILQSLVNAGTMPAPQRNSIGQFPIGDVEICAARTGYTGEPVCFELFMAVSDAPEIWNKLIDAGAAPVGLGARDTLRLEAGLPLYGHELGTGKDGEEIPIYAIPQSPFAISFDDPNRAFIGRAALEAQAQARVFYKVKDFSDVLTLPKVVRKIRLLDKGIARDGAEIYFEDDVVGWVSSGTMVPHWGVELNGETAHLTDEHTQRAVGLCLISPEVPMGATVEVDVRGRRLKAVVVVKNLENRKGNVTYAVV